MTNRGVEKEVARALINIGAVGFSPNSPVTFKSGIKSPVYVDNRKFPFYPEEWKKVIAGFKDLAEKNKINFDVIAGVEAAGIPHSAALGFYLEKPSIFVRKEAKDHGTKKRIEGGDIKNKKVVLIEDLVSTGISSLSVVEALRNEGAVVQDVMVIVTYGFKESEDAFDKSNVRISALTSFPVILEEAFAMGKFNKEERQVIEDWFYDHQGWAERHGFN